MASPGQAAERCVSLTAKIYNLSSGCGLCCFLNKKELHHVLEPMLDQDALERARMACLRNLKILDTTADKRIDKVTFVAAQHFNVPIALVSLVDENRQWFKSKVGLEAEQTPRCDAFCTHTIREPSIMIIPDAQCDARFKENPLVLGAPHIRFYAGANIAINDTHNIGTLCIIDDKPRNFDAQDAAKLTSLAHSIRLLIERTNRSRNALVKMESAFTSRKKLSVI